jgi:hypothetical protein
VVRAARVLERQAIPVALALAAALGACKKKEPAPAPMAAILASEPNIRARALRDEMERLAAAGKLDDAASRTAAVAKTVGDLLEAMDRLHHRKTAVPDFDVVRYVEALRDLGNNLRGFERIWSPKNPDTLKREMIQGLIDQMKRKIR